MADRVEALVLQMSADIRKLETGMAKARATTSKNLGEIEKKAIKTNGVLKSVADDIGSDFSKAGGNIPIVGSALKGLGPAALIGAAGVGAIALAFTGLWQEGRKAMAELDRIGTFAADTSLGIEVFQALELEAMKTRVEGEQLVSMLKAFDINASKAAAGTGKFVTALKDSNPELVKAVASATSMEERLQIMADALAKTSDRSEQVRIATSAFGKQGAVMIRIFNQMGGSIAATTEAYRQQGLIIDDELINSTAALDDQYDILVKRIQNNLTTAFAGLAPTIEAVTAAMADASSASLTLFESFKPIEDRSFGTLLTQEKESEALLRSYKKTIDEIRARKGSLAAALDIGGRESNFVNAAIKEQQRLLQIKGALSFRRQDASSKSSATAVDDPEEDAALESAAKARVDRLKTLATAAAQLLGQLGDTSKLLAAEEIRLNEIRDAGLLTQDQVNQLMIQYEASLTKVSDAEKEAAAQQQRWLDILASGQTPVEKAQAEISKFWEAVSEGTAGPPAQAQAVLAVLTANLDEAAEAARRATPEFLAIAEARKRITDAEVAGQSSAERIAAERKRLNGLVGPAFGQGEADTAFKIFVGDELDSLRQGTRDSVKEGIRQGLATDDWGEQIRNVLADAIVDGFDTSIDKLTTLLTNFILGVQNSQTGETSGGIIGAIGQFFGGKRAAGGPVGGGKTFLVGENGPELLRMSGGQSGQVFNAAQVNSMGSGSGPSTAAYVDARVTIGGVDMATWPQVKAALNAQAQAITSRLPGAVNATLADNRKQKRRF